MQKFKKIAVVTGSRSEYGLLYWLLKELQNNDQIELQLIVTGTHLSPYFGLTINEIIKDGFNINAKVELLIDSDTHSSVGKSVGIGVISFIDTLNYLSPDLIIVLGDRFEILAASQAAFFLKIPIAHIHGGEVTTGALDDSIRHAITKLSSLHFVSTEVYRKRVIQMGEQPDRVFMVGAPGLEHLQRSTLYNKAELEKILNFAFDDINFFLVYHPATNTNDNYTIILENILDILLSYEHSKIFISGSNADAFGRTISLLLEKKSKQFLNRIFMSPSLGQKIFFKPIELL